RTVLWNPNVVNQILARQRYSALRFIFYDSPRNFPANRRDFTFQIAHAGFTSVLTNDALNAIFRERNVLRFEAVGFDLFGNEEASSDLGFFVFGVSGQTQRFHAILQRLR